MFRNPQARGFVDNAKSAARLTANDFRGRAEGFARDVRGQLPEAEDFLGRIAGNARRLVNKQPLACLAAVGVLGVLIGLSGRARR